MKPQWKLENILTDNENTPIKIHGMGVRWQSSGKDSELSLPRTWVQSLVRELRSRKLCGVAKKKKEKKFMGFS